MPYTPPSTSLSLIIPSFNGAGKITRLLKSISAQALAPHEVILSLDGSTDNTAEVISHFHPNFPLVVLDNLNGGRSVARNLGAERAQGSHLLFLDDDMRISPTCLAQHSQHHAQYPHTILIGRVSIDTRLLSKDFDFYLAKLFEKWGKTFTSKTRVDIQHFIFTTSHLSLPNRLFNSLNGFDARLTDGEDYDLGMRALQQHIDIYYDPNIVAWHDDFPSCQKYILRQIEYKKSHIRILELNKGYDPLFVPLTTPTNIIKRLLLCLLAFPAWVSAIDRERLIVLPKKWRHKLYASIIYAQTLRGLKLI